MADARMLVTLTVAELVEIIDLRVAAVLEQRRPAEQRLVDRAGLGRALLCSLPLVDRLVREGAPHARIGDMRRFDVEEVVAWLKVRSAPKKLAVVR